MPINANVSASDYTTYLKQKAISAANTFEPRLNNAPVPTAQLNTGLLASRMSKILNPGGTALAAPVVQSLPRPVPNTYRAKSTVRPQ